MDVNKFCTARPHLYHLTSRDNMSLITEHKLLFSTNRLIDMAGIDPAMKRTKRLNHIAVTIGDGTYWLRDQQPISEKALAKCLTHKWTCEDYYSFLNDRVFTWPTINRLTRHFTRYKSEGPIIIRIASRDTIDLNPNALFCRLNSGATRANSFLGGKPPSRGRETFLRSEDYNLSISTIAEVTFLHELILPSSIDLGESPIGPWTSVEL